MFPEGLAFLAELSFSFNLHTVHKNSEIKSIFSVTSRSVNKYIENQDFN